jgi:hypothetical protein
MILCSLIAGTLRRTPFRDIFIGAGNASLANVFSAQIANALTEILQNSPFGRITAIRNILAGIPDVQQECSRLYPFRPK